MGDTRHRKPSVVSNSTRPLEEAQAIVNTEDKKKRLNDLRDEMAHLEKELQTEPEVWKRTDAGYYGMYHATTGLMLGILGAMASLLFNIVGSLVAGHHPLRLIQVYSTFPLGERALTAEFETGIALAVGCCLYIGTGMLLGIPFQMSIARLLPNGGLTARLVFATALGLLLWVVNFYGILSWLQPMLIGGNWIVDPTILPPWVGAATHLVFAWTMACVYPWGKYEARQPAAD